ncbi:MAG: AIR synthase-related protein [Planctomycetota bacterium]
MGRLFTVTVSTGEDRYGPDGELLAALEDLGLEGLGLEGAMGAWLDHVYILKLPEHNTLAEVEPFAREFLAGGPALHPHLVEGVGFPARSPEQVSLIILRKSGVMDPVEGSVRHALRDAGWDPESCRVRTARRYRMALPRSLTRERLQRIATARLANPIVDVCYAFLHGEEESFPDPFQDREPAMAGRVEVTLRGLDDCELLQLSGERGLSLNLEELHAIQRHYHELDREPTDVELETLAQTWSEHCCHKTLTGPIDYKGERIDNVLKETIFAVTRELAAPFCWSVFQDNAGVIAIDQTWGLSFKVETHNHPSALEPYGGAGTGIGGVIRDTLGTGLGARPVLSTNVFCLAPFDTPPHQLPAGSLSPRRLLTGVVAGVRDYGNRMGIPTANGAIFFHPGFLANPLVFCGSVGLIPRTMVEKHVEPEDLIVVIGGRTGRDGIRGATFSSRELTEESETLSSGAVQIGNPIEEKKLQDALLRARDAGLYRAVTDCGAGGFSSAVGEMGQELGAEVELSHAPLKYAGLSPCEIWISEAQERMVLAVPPEHQHELFAILDEEEVEGCVLGRFTATGQLRLCYQEELVGEISMSFLYQGRPRILRHAVPPQPPAPLPLELDDVPLSTWVRRLLSHPNVASKEPVIRMYDHEVQGRMVIRPLVGAHGVGPGDGAAFDPLRDGRHTVVVGCGMQILLGELDPYQMGAQSVDEALRNVIASGGSLNRCALLDNFAWGDVNDPQVLGALVECARGAADAAQCYGTPFISGKDSLHNVYRAEGEVRSIPHTLLVSAVSVVEGPPRAPTSDLKRHDSLLIWVGPVQSGIDGSLLQFLGGSAGGTAPRFHRRLGRQVLARVEEWIASGQVRAAHDLSEGGLVVAASEMAIGGEGVGLVLHLDALPGGQFLSDVDLLCGEAPHRFLLEVDRQQAESWLSRAGEVPMAIVGHTTGDGRLVVERNGQTRLSFPVAELRELWRAPLAEVWPLPRAAP